MKFNNSESMETIKQYFNRQNSLNSQIIFQSSPTFQILFECIHK